jgi:hypothetical protein
MTWAWDPTDLPDAAEFDAFRWAREHSRFGDGDRAARRRRPPLASPPGSQDLRPESTSQYPHSPGDPGPGERPPASEPDNQREATRP